MRVYTGGTFDLFHTGHVNFLKMCANFGEVWVGLNSDEFAERYKRKPVLTYDERLGALEGCKWVTEVVRNWGDEDSKPAIEYVNPRYIAHGNDWQGASLEKQMGLSPEWLEEQGIEMLYIPYTPRISTSQIIERICPCSSSRSSARSQDDTKTPSRFCIGCA